MYIANKIEEVKEKIALCKECIFDLEHDNGYQYSKEEATLEIKKCKIEIIYLEDSLRRLEIS